MWRYIFINSYCKWETTINYKLFCVSSNYYKASVNLNLRLCRPMGKQLCASWKDWRILPYIYFYKFKVYLLRVYSCIYIYDYRSLELTHLCCLQVEVLSLLYLPKEPAIRLSMTRMMTKSLNLYLRYLVISWWVFV